MNTSASWLTASSQLQLAHSIVLGGREFAWEPVGKFLCPSESLPDRTNKYPRGWKTWVQIIFCFSSFSLSPLAVSYQHKSRNPHTFVYQILMRHILKFSSYFRAPSMKTWGQIGSVHHIMSLNSAYWGFRPRFLDSNTITTCIKFANKSGEMWLSDNSQ